MDWRYLLISTYFSLITANSRHVNILDVQENERVRLQCTVTSTKDAEEAMWMRIRSPHNPDILTYRESVVYASDRLVLERRLINAGSIVNGTLIDTYFLTLIILRPTTEDEGRYVCARGRTVFAEYDLYIIVPTQFVDDKNFIPQAVVEGSTLRLSCSAYGRPSPTINWYYRADNGKLVLLGNQTGCQHTICELHLSNYTRYDPKVIECIADNEKSTRISKVFYVDVFYKPQITTNVRTLTGLRSIDVFLECSSRGNPTPSITWLDENRQTINHYALYEITTTNQSTMLSFTIFPNENPRVLYYCRSNNSIGVDERAISIADFIRTDTQFDYQSATVKFITESSSRKQQTMKSNRMKSKLSTTVTTTKTVSSNSSVSYISNILSLMCIIFNFLK